MFKEVIDVFFSFATIKGFITTQNFMIGIKQAAEK